MSKFPKVEKGSHLTVTTFEDGSTKLEWDWDQLVKDVQNAIASVDKPKAVKNEKVNTNGKKSSRGSRRK